MTTTNETHNSVTFRMPDADAPSMEGLSETIRAGADALRADGITEPFSITVTIEGHYPSCPDGA